MDPARAEDVARSIVDWFATAARELRWRSEPTPYHVLLSELMLQQTRVETVVPYFDRFVERWPTLEALAEASEQDVLHAWSGLGYYSRARNLLRCARAAVDAGGLPSDPDALRALPGIGPYTAGAVASIAFGVRTPLVDGNVERVLSRLDHRTEDPRSKEGRAGLWTRAGELLDALPEGAHPGALNQGLMELGATVCTPRSPRCASCPVESLCLAKDRDPESLPLKAPKPRPKEVRAVAAIVTGPDGVLLGRRPPGLLGGLWEPLGTEIEGAADEDAVRELVLREAGSALVDVRSLGSAVHVFTHKRQLTAVFEGRLAEAFAPPGGGFYAELRWVVDPGSVPLSTRARRILALRDSPQLGLPLAAEPD